MKVLVAGVGSIGQRHIRNLRALLGSGVEILAYRVRRLRHTLTEQMEIAPDQDVETAYGLRVFDDLDEALAERPAAVFVCNPTSAHMSVALAAARAGCHLFIEKPLAHTLDGVDDLIATVEERRLVALVGYQMRFHPCLLRLQTLLREQAIGRIVSVHAEVGEYLPDTHPYEDYRSTYAARACLGGGVILSQIHELDYLQWLFGRPRRLFTVGGHLSALDLDVEDTATTLMECEIDGRVVPVVLHQDFVQRPGRRTCRIVGDAGRIEMDLRRPRLDWLDSQGSPIECTIPEGFERNALFLNELEHFLACIEGRVTPHVSLREGAESLRLALAAKASMTSGEAVEFH